jgi:hypothetical protein
MVTIEADEEPTDDTRACFTSFNNYVSCTKLNANTLTFILTITKNVAA